MAVSTFSPIARRAGALALAFCVVFFVVDQASAQSAVCDSARSIYQVYATSNGVTQTSKLLFLFRFCFVCNLCNFIVCTPFQSSPQSSFSAGNRSSDVNEHYFGFGEKILIQAELCDPVTITSGTVAKMELDLDAGPAFKAVLSSTLNTFDSPVSVLIFEYTVESGDHAKPLDYVDGSAVVVESGGSILNQAGVALAPPNLLLPLYDEVPRQTISDNQRPDTFQRLTLIDTIPPEVVSVNVDFQNDEIQVGDQVKIEVRFNEPHVTINTLQTHLIHLNSAPTFGSASGVFFGISPTLEEGHSIFLFRYTVQAGDWTEDLDYLESMPLSLASEATDGALNVWSRDLPALESGNSISNNPNNRNFEMGAGFYTIDTPPRIVRVDSPAPGDYGVGAALQFVVWWSKPTTTTSGTIQGLVLNSDAGTTIVASFESTLVGRVCCVGLLVVFCVLYRLSFVRVCCVCFAYVVVCVWGGCVCK